MVVIVVAAALHVGGGSDFGIDFCCAWSSVSGGRSGDSVGGGRAKSKTVHLNYLLG